MTSIQLIIITGCLLAVVVSSWTFHSRLAYRLVAIALFSMATFLVLFPGVTTDIANTLGVGRGTDLLVYIGLLAGIHAFLLLYMRTRLLERKLTDVVRATAIATGHP